MINPSCYGQRGCPGLVVLGATSVPEKSTTLDIQLLLSLIHFLKALLLKLAFEGYISQSSNPGVHDTSLHFNTDYIQIQCVNLLYQFSKNSLNTEVFVNMGWIWVY